MNKAGGTKQTVLQPPTLTDKTIGACRHDACKLRFFYAYRRMRISPSPTTADKEKPKKYGGNMEKDCGGRPRFVSFFLFQFAFCPFMQYLCNGKRSTCVLLFYALKVPTPPKETFHPTLRGVIRPEWPCIRGPFDLSFGPNELPSVAVRQNRLDLAGNLMGLTGRTRRMGKHGKASMGKLRVRLFRKI